MTLIEIFADDYRIPHGSESWQRRSERARALPFGPIPGLGGTVRWQIVADRGLGSGRADYYSRFSAVTRII
jgi:hypothetical protein